MEYLASYCHPCQLQEAVERLRRNDLPERAVVVTFDDGYRDNYEYAFPILQRFGIPATIFLATGAIGSGRMIWHDRIFRAFRTTKATKLDLPGMANGFPLRTLVEKRAAQARVLQHLFDLADEERCQRIEQLEKRLAVTREDAAAHTMLGWDEVSTMFESGISFGSHTISHPILSKLTEPRLVEEVAESKRVIEAKVKHPINAFAYPIGRRQDFNDRVKAIVKEAGYQYAVTTVFGVNEPGQDAFELRRATPWTSHIPSFAARLSWYRFVANG
jgi:peptidoglycan/xylan/chitin deacetylase (PgdA/CDA1 family)